MKSLFRFTCCLLILPVSHAALACRCAERTLAEYYASADTVLVAAITSVAANSSDLHYKVQFEPLGTPWKQPASASIRKDFLTSNSSADCGLDVEANDIWVLFHDQSKHALITTCSGSRALNRNDHAASNTISAGFIDVPANFIATQLNALAGLDLLRELQTTDSAQLLGLLDIKTLTHGGSVTIYAESNDDSTILSKIGKIDTLQHREASYEFAAASVYAKNDFGFQIRLADGRNGWLAQEHAGTWFTYPELVVNRLNYLHPEWHGFLWPDAGAGIPLRLDGKNSSGRKHAARVKGLTRIADSLWLQVDVLTSDGCDGKPVKTIASGWTPAWLVDGQPAAWFYSRGC